MWGGGGGAVGANNMVAGGGGKWMGGSLCRMLIIRNGNVALTDLTFKKTSCCPVKFKKIPCRHVDFLKLPCQMSLRPKRAMSPCRF